LTTSKPAGSSSAPNFATDGAWSAITLLAPSTIGEPMAWSDQRAIDLRYGRRVLALQLHKSAAAEASPLALVELAEPGPAAGELVLDVAACAVCRTDLQLVEGDLEARRLPIVPGHQAVGRVHQLGQDVAGWEVGERAGVAWLASTCGECQYCLTSRENLCPRARFTGWDRDGGYATRIVVRADFALRIPDGFDDLAAAPLLCGGVIGYRSLKMSGIEPGGRLGLFGFGASALLALQVARFWDCEVHVRTRSPREQQRALELGAKSAAAYDEATPLSTPP
jgi:propanol-preferring alcohol dehydrogenase